MPKSMCHDRNSSLQTDVTSLDSRKTVAAQVGPANFTWPGSTVGQSPCLASSSLNLVFARRALSMGCRGLVGNINRHDLAAVGRQFEPYCVQCSDTML